MTWRWCLSRDLWCMYTMQPLFLQQTRRINSNQEYLEQFPGPHFRSGRICGQPTRAVYAGHSSSYLRSLCRNDPPREEALEKPPMRCQSKW